LIEIFQGFYLPFIDQKHCFRFKRRFNQLEEFFYLPWGLYGLEYSKLIPRLPQIFLR